MKKVLLSILAIIVLGVGGLAIYAATRPDTFQIERSISINKAPEAVYPHISNFRNWEAWSPWEKLDPKMKKNYSGAESGMGAIYEWEGNDKVGKGKMEIKEAVPGSKISIKLDFLEPMEVSNITDFTLTSEGTATKVTWNMHGNNNFVAKLFSIFMNMDEMIGKDFNQGLTDLKKAVESQKDLVDASASTGALIIERTFDAPAKAVWEAWTVAEKIKKWWGPTDWTCPTANIDFKVGGKYLFSMKGPDGMEMWSTGTFKEIEPMKKIVATDSFSNEKGDIVDPATLGFTDAPKVFEMEITFEEIDKNKSKMILRHTGFSEGKLKEMSREGWGMSFDKLAASLKS